MHSSVQNGFPHLTWPVGTGMQVKVAPDNGEKTAFCTLEGLFEFRTMPFGFCNAPATFQRLMDFVPAGLQWSYA